MTAAPACAPIAEKFYPALSIFRKAVRPQDRDEDSLRSTQGHETMRYMMIVKADKDYEAGKPPNPALIAAIGKLGEDMTAQGILLQTEGLFPTSHAMRMKLAKGKVSVTDGPFTETKEVIGGFAILKADSKDDALALARRFFQVHIDAGITDMEMDIRPVFDQGCQ
jgi:hypothetical protein